MKKLSLIKATLQVLNRQLRFKTIKTSVSMDHLEKYFALKKNEKTYYQLIALKENSLIVIKGVLEQNAVIEIKYFEDIEALQKELEHNVLAISEQGYTEYTKSEELSVFSVVLEQLKTEDILQFEDGIQTLKGLVDIYYDRKTHPFVQFLRVKMTDEELATTPILDNYLKKHIYKLSSASLVHIFQMTLKNIYFNFEATQIATEEIIKRKDLKAQLAIVDQFYQACEYYDSGHRSWCDTIHDMLIDTYFPDFESEALLKLLKKDSEDSGNMLHSDGMDTLFKHALYNTNDKNLQQRILNVLETYKKEYEEDDYKEEEYFDNLLEKLLESSSESIAQGINAIKENKQKRNTLLKAIENFDSKKVEILLDEGALFDDRLKEMVLDLTLEKNDLSFINLFRNKGIEYEIEKLFLNPDKHINMLTDGIESGIINTEYQENISQKTLLFFVTENIQLIDVLLKKGLDVNHQDNSGYTILGKVCSAAEPNNTRQKKIIQLLLDYNADPNIGLNNNGWNNGMTPLHYAIKNEAIEIVKLLISAKADVNAMPDNGKNPLMLAYEKDNNAIIDILKNANAIAPERELLKIQFIRYASKQQWEKLLEMEEVIVSEFSDNFIVYVNLAQVYYHYKRDYIKAAIYAKKALSIRVDNKSLNILFMSLIRLGQVQSVIDIFIMHEKNFNPEKALSNNIIANLIVAYCSNNQVKEGLKVLSPYFDIVKESRREKGVVNFNIACMYALANDTHEMLPYVIQALEREYTKDDFLSESDFADYHADELFLFILNQDHKNTITLENYSEDIESNTFKKVSVKAIYNTGTFSFDDNEHEFAYETGNIGENGRTQERLYTSKAQALTMYFEKLKAIHFNKKDSYFILKEVTSVLDEEAEIQAPKKIIDDVDFLSGKEITKSIDLPMVFSTNAIAGDTILDFNDGKIPVVSKRFLDQLKGAGVKSIQSFPVVIKSKYDNTEWKNYFAINLLDIVTCGAFPKSIFTKDTPKHGIRCELAIDTEKIDGSLLFRLQEHLPTILINRSVGKYIVDNDPDKELKWQIGEIIQY